MIEIVLKHPHAFFYDKRFELTPRYIVNFTDTDDFLICTADEVGQLLGGN